MPLSLALILATHLVATEVGGTQLGIVAAAMVAMLIGATWWLGPLLHRTHALTPGSGTEVSD